MVLLLLVVLCVQTAFGLLYMPEKGLIWDPSCLVRKGKFFCFFMYNAENSTFYHNGLLATSTDGVHFTNEEVIDTDPYPHGKIPIIKTIYHAFYALHIVLSCTV